jgi:exopolyphosphatase/guanosine-5'-triphosphate,3'-diphosphate pyrophosphatase
MAESLDRSHAGLIRHARFLPAAEAGPVLQLTIVGECQLEMSGIENEAENFRSVFGERLITRTVTAGLEELHESNGDFPAIPERSGS